jgi:hypothetical protein
MQKSSGVNLQGSLYAQNVRNGTSLREMCIVTVKVGILHGTFLCRDKVIGQIITLVYGHFRYRKDNHRSPINYFKTSDLSRHWRKDFNF